MCTCHTGENKMHTCICAYMHVSTNEYMHTCHTGETALLLMWDMNKPNMHTCMYAYMHMYAWLKTRIYVILGKQGVVAHGGHGQAQYAYMHIHVCMAEYMHTCHTGETRRCCSWGTWPCPICIHAHMSTGICMHD